MALASLAWLFSPGSAVGQDKIPASAKRPKEAGAWLKLLQSPAKQADVIPNDWKVIPQSPVAPGGGTSGACAIGLDLPRSIDRLVGESEIVVVGVGAGNDGGFYPARPDLPPSRFQFTTYYLRVEGYLKDDTGRRASFLKILAPGGFRDGGQPPAYNIFFPYLQAGKRYLLYLRRNTGFEWGLTGAIMARDTILIGRGDEFCTTGWSNGRWFEDEKGRLGGQVGDPVGDPKRWAGLGALLPFEQAVARVRQGVRRQAALEAQLARKRRE